MQAAAKKAKDSLEVAKLNSEIKELNDKKKEIVALQKAENDVHFHYSLAAKAYSDAERITVQYENYSHLDELDSMYDEAKRRADEADAAAAAQTAKEQAEEKAYSQKLKAEKKAAKEAKKAKKKAKKNK